MTEKALFLNPADAAQQLGVSPKALRLYEERGLIKPTRTANGWRTYGPNAMDRAREIIALRSFGLSLAQIGQVLAGDTQTLLEALTTQQAALERAIGQHGATIAAIKDLRVSISAGGPPEVEDLVRLLDGRDHLQVAFDLPWPWDGERFSLQQIRPLTYITGPLGSGKTRLAMAIADALPNGRFVGLERMDMPPEASIYATLLAGGARDCAALRGLVHVMENAGDANLVIDLVEHGLDRASQEALIACLKHRTAAGPPMFVMTRSDAILDLEAAGPNEAVLFCPANHSPPVLVAPYPGAAGYEAVASCLAPPEVRARTEGFVATRVGAD
ncbi:MAG: MerR family transcriptional regulator [Pseudomonadota bacterium]